MLDLAFNHVTKEIIVLTSNDREEFWISSYSATGEKRQTVPSFGIAWPASLTSHPSGPVALVQSNSVLYIQ